MQIEIRERKLGEIPVGAILMVPLFFLPLGAFLVGTDTIDLGICGFKMMFGLPCLTCGSTRATLHLLDGSLLEALRHQPMMLSIYALLLVWGALSLWAFATRKSLKLKLTDREDWALKAVIVGVPCGNWAYLIAAGI